MQLINLVLNTKNYQGIDMKPQIIQKERNSIDNTSGHNEVLFELGLLDDMDDWSLYQLQEKKFDQIVDEIDQDKYLIFKGRCNER